MKLSVMHRHLFAALYPCCLGLSALLSSQMAMAELIDKSKINGINIHEVYKASDSDEPDLAQTDDDIPTYDGVDDFDAEVDDFENDVDDSSDDIDIAKTQIEHDENQPHTNIPLNAISPTTLKTFVEVIDLVRRHYIEPVNDEELFNDAMSGMLTKLDSHAEFLDASAYENLRAFTQGDVGGVGLQAVYQPDVGYWVVTDVVPNSSADLEGIKVGDYLHQIGEVKLTDSKTPNDIEQMLTGIAGSHVEVMVSKAGRRKRIFALQRNQARQQDIQVQLQESIAIVKLPVFQNNSRQKLLDGLANLDAPITGVLIDVRDNPGGVLEAAVEIAGLFMPDTTVVQVQNRQGKERILRTPATATLKSLPVIILQNRYSASAAEVLASSLQENGRALVVGETSYGKGSVQSVIPINDEQAIKLTVAHYLTAKGQQIDEVGVTPDIALDGNEGLWGQQALTLLLGQERLNGIKFVRPKAKTDTETQDGDNDQETNDIQDSPQDDKGLQDNKIANNK